MARVLFEQPFSRKRADLIDSLIKFTLNHLAPEQTRRTVINVVAQRGLMKNEGSCADVTPDDVRGTGEYTIRVDPSIDNRLLLLSIAHETVHVKQFATGQEKVSTASDFVRDTSQTSDAYWDDPLEIEAYGRELGLLVRWVAQNGHAKKAWARGVFNP